MVQSGFVIQLIVFLPIDATGRKKTIYNTCRTTIAVRSRIQVSAISEDNECDILSDRSASLATWHNSCIFSGSLAESFYLVLQDHLTIYFTCFTYVHALGNGFVLGLLLSFILVLGL